MSVLCSDSTMLACDSIHTVDTDAPRKAAAGEQLCVGLTAAEASGRLQELEERACRTEMGPLMMLIAVVLHHLLQEASRLRSSPPEMLPAICTVSASYQLVTSYMACSQMPRVGIE